MNIFFDFDGTLIDAKPRLYTLFQNLIPDSGLSYEEYWALKKNRIGHREILQTQYSYTFKQWEEFESKWLAKIESDELLRLDCPFEGVTQFLTFLRRNHSIFLITARQFREKVYEQLHWFGWQSMFDGIYVTEGKTEKANLIATNVKVSEVDWLVGDTGKDIQTGKKLHMNTAAVLSGFQNRDRLVEYSPNLVVESVINLDFSIYE